MISILDKYLTGFHQGTFDVARDFDHAMYIALRALSLEEKQDLLSYVERILREKDDSDLMRLVDTDYLPFRLQQHEGVATHLLTEIAKVARKVVEAGGDDGGRGSMRNPPNS